MEFDQIPNILKGTKCYQAYTLAPLPPVLASRSFITTVRKSCR
jgi:hypothetical protein